MLANCHPQLALGPSMNDDKKKKGSQRGRKRESKQNIKNKRDSSYIPVGFLDFVLRRFSFDTQGIVELGLLHHLNGCWMTGRCEFSLGSSWWGDDIESEKLE